jgi:hypothetical protein
VRKWTLLLLILLLAAGSVRAAGDDDDASTPKENFLKFRLTATNGDRHPYGWVLVDGYNFGMGAQGLRPNEIYTVWMVKSNGEKAGIGEAPYSFQARDSGEGKYIVKLPDNAIFTGDYQKIVIYHHPDGNPETMEGMLPILEGPLK